jgi:predicted enzyme related to lactoylglutathione lyase
MTQHDTPPCFEILAPDLERAQRFYAALLDIQASAQQARRPRLAAASHDDGRSGSAPAAVRHGLHGAGA